jgi:iron complex outermembrane receptor protein
VGFFILLANQMLQAQIPDSLRFKLEGAGFQVSDSIIPNSQLRTPNFQTPELRTPNSKLQTFKLPETTIRDARFEQTGFTAWRADSLPLAAPISLAERLLWDNPLALRANAPGTLATVSARGAGPSRTPVLWSGLNLQSPMNGVVDASLLPIWPGDLLQVRYGGQSAAQSAGAMGGSVVVEPGGMISPGFSGLLAAGLGSFGTREANARVGFSQSKWSTDARAHWVRADNDFTFKNFSQIGQPTVRQPNNAGERWNFQQFNRLVINEKNVLKTAVWHQRSFREIPPAMTESPAETWQRDRANRAVLTWERSPHPRARWQTRAAWLDEFIAFRLAGATDTSRSRQVLLSSDYAATQSRWAWKMGGNLLRQWAQADGYADSARWYGQWRAAAFGMAERRLRDGGRLSLLLRQEWAEGQAAPFTGSLGGEISLARAGFLRGHFSRNFNLPTFNDRFWQAYGNADLRPERGYSADFGWGFRRGRFSTEVLGFQMVLDDWILWQPGADGVFRPNNLRKVWSRGGEVSGSWQWAIRGWQWQASARFQVSKTTNVAVYGGSESVLHKQLPYTPQAAGGATLRAARGGWSAAYLQQWTGRRFTTSDNAGRLPAFQTGAFLLQFRFKKINLTLDGRIENVWDSPYQIIAYRPMPGRSGRIGATLGW